MFDSRRCTRFPPSLIWSLEGLQQNLSLGTNPIDNAEPCFPHDSNVGDHLHDECRLSNEPSFCHKLLSTWWLIEQVCSLTKKCQVYQFVQSTSISRQFVSIFLTIPQLIQVPLSWNGDHPSKGLRLCTVALFFLFCQLAVSFNSFLSVPFQVAGPRNRLCAVVPAEIRDSKFFRFTRDQEMRLVRQDQHFSSISSTWEPDTASFQPFKYYPRIPISIILVFSEQRDIPNSVLFPIQVLVKLLRIVFPITIQLMGVQKKNSFKKNHWIFNVWPRFRPFMSWKTYPCIWTFWL